MSAKKDKKYSIHQWIVDAEYERNDGKLIEWQQKKPTFEESLDFLLQKKVKVTKLPSTAKHKRRTML